MDNFILILLTATERDLYFSILFLVFFFFCFLCPKTSDIFFDKIIAPLFFEFEQLPLTIRAICMAVLGIILLGLMFIAGFADKF